MDKWHGHLKRGQRKDPFGVIWLNPELIASITIGLTFTVLFILSWIMFLWGDGDSGRMAVCTFFAIFAMPLFIGSVLVFLRRRSGLRFLRFGSWILLCEPGTWARLRTIDKNPIVAAHLAGGCPPTG
jgi:hypothetical protein